MTRSIVTAIRLALFVGFLTFMIGLIALTTAMVGVGSKILGVPTPTLPTIPAFSFQFEAGAEYTDGQGEVGGSFAFGFGESQTANQAANTSLGRYPTFHGGKASLNSFAPTHVNKASVTSKNTSTTKMELGVNTAPGRTFFVPKSHQSLGR